jgi:aryl-alcohol dehydrogenase-like predicted oxidoreductase
MLKRERVEKELVPFFNTKGLGTTVWSPLAGGLLTGKYNSGELPADSRYATNDFLSGTLGQYFADDKKASTVAKLQGLGTIANEL